MVFPQNKALFQSLLFFILPKRIIIRQKRIGGIKFVASSFSENGICFIFVGWNTISKRKGHTGNILFSLPILHQNECEGDRSDTAKFIPEPSNQLHKIL